MHSEDCKLITPTNTWSDFTVTLPDAIFLGTRGEWEMAVLELCVNSTKYEPTFKHKHEPIYMMCDEVEATVADAKYKRVLTMFRLKDTYRSVKQFEHPYYMKLTGDRLASIRLYIRDSEGGVPAVSESSTWCTLHLRKSSHN